MEQQPPNSEDGRRDKTGRGKEEEHFVLEPEPPRRLRRWLSADEEPVNAEAYEPQQFDLDSLPEEDEASAADRLNPSAPALESTDASGKQAAPLGFVSEPRPVRVKPIERPAEQPPAPPAGHDETPPLGFVSEPRPVKPENLSSSESKLGFIDTAAQQPGPAADPTAPSSEESSSTAAPEAAAVTDASRTPGQILRQTREEQGLSTEDIVLQTRMPLETVLALEEDRDPEQSAWVYVRGFYRRYARALNIADAPLLEAHARMAGEPEPLAQPVASEWAPQDVSPGPSPIPKMIFVVLASVVLGVTAWWFGPQVGAYIDDLNLRQKASSAYSGAKSAAAAATHKGAELADSAAQTVKTQGAVVVGTAAEQYNKAAEKLKAEATPLIEAARAQREAVKRQSGATVEAEPTATEPATGVEQPAPAMASEASPAVDDRLAQSGPEEPGQARAEAAETEPEPATLAEAQPEAEPQTESAPVAAEPMLEPETTGPPDSAPAAPTEDAGGRAAATAAAVLELEFSRQTWLSVADGTGLVLFEDMVEGGSSKRLEGEPPLTLFLGTATAANAWFNGQPVNIASQMRSNGTARILLE